MRLLLCGGGTAGHITPAIAIAEELKSSHLNSDVLFIGREGGKENHLITKSGFKYETINIQGIKRSFSLDNFKRIIKAIKALSKAREIIGKFQPDVILGTGGYVCWPVITAGKKLGIPTAIHESNIIPGLTTKLLASKCDKIFINNDETKKYFNSKEKIITVGNPLRKDFIKKGRTESRRNLGVDDDDDFLIISFGGSIGSAKINETIIELIKDYSSKKSDIIHIHAVGNNHRNLTKKNNFPLGRCKIIPFFDDMATAMNAADLVICRCGAMTLSEICEVGVMSILIPSPNVTANHQLVNGRHLERKKAAILIEEKNLSTSKLIGAIKSIKNDKFGRKTRAKILKSLSTPNSAKVIVKHIFDLKNR